LNAVSLWPLARSRDSDEPQKQPLDLFSFWTMHPSADPEAVEAGDGVPTQRTGDWLLPAVHTPCVTAFLSSEGEALGLIIAPTFLRRPRPFAGWW
jgi:hypothetical protein